MINISEMSSDNDELKGLLRRYQNRNMSSEYFIRGLLSCRQFFLIGIE